jgi:CheY-like chemotaxis protein
VRFEVEDSGIGIPEDRLVRLFQSFEQADSSTTRKYGGTGLGLAISRHLAVLMGGEANASSQLGQGSQFWFTARLVRGATPAGELASKRAAAMETARLDGGLLTALSGRRVLLVEDNHINQEVALELLNVVGIRADLAGDGQEAVDKAREHAYELILMDVQMPVMDGLAATAAIRQLPGHATTPILAMTASVFAEERNHCFKAGMNAVLPKPVDPEALYGELARWLPERRKPGVERGTADLTTSEADDESARAVLDAIAGLDTAVGLASVRGRMSSYVRLLRIFARNHGADMKLLRAQLAAGDLDAARRNAHSLKGVCGTLGAAGVQTLAGDLETALREADTDKPHSAAFEERIAFLDQHLSALTTVLLAALPEPEAPSSATRDKPAASAAVVRAARERLEGLLSSDDLWAVAALRESRTTLASALSAEVLARLSAQVEEYDFHAALETLRGAEFDGAG